MWHRLSNGGRTDREELYFGFYVVHDVLKYLLAWGLELEITSGGKKLEDEALLVQHLHLRALVDVEVANVFPEFLPVTAATEAMLVDGHPPRVGLGLGLGLR